jgi:hypothetical protein
MRMLREKAQRTPPNQWVRVIAGSSEFQFAEKRMPTLDELNAAAPEAGARGVLHGGRSRGSESAGLLHRT